MKGYKEIGAKGIVCDMISKISEEWMLVSAGEECNFNTMTASWGGVGFLWGKAVAFVFIRPQRHTFGYVEKYERMSLTFFGKGEKAEALKICGSKSGRECNKVKEAGLEAMFTESGTPTFKDAEMVIEGRKLYAQTLDGECFIEKELVERWFAAGDFHKMYVVEIEKVYVRE